MLISQVLSPKCTAKQEDAFCTAWLQARTTIGVSIFYKGREEKRALHPAYAEVIKEVLQDIRLRCVEDIPLMLHDEKYSRMQKQFLVYLLENI